MFFISVNQWSFTRGEEEEEWRGEDEESQTHRQPSISDAWFRGLSLWLSTSSPVSPIHQSISQTATHDIAPHRIASSPSTLTSLESICLHFPPQLLCQRTSEWAGMVPTHACPFCLGALCHQRHVGFIRTQSDRCYSVAMPSAMTRDSREEIKSGVWRSHSRNENTRLWLWKVKVSKRVWEVKVRSGLRKVQLLSVLLWLKGDSFCVQWVKVLPGKKETLWCLQSENSC